MHLSVAAYCLILLFCNIACRVDEGSFGVVSRGTWRGSEVAIKRIKDHIIEEDKNHFLEESKWMRYISYYFSNQIDCIDATTTDNRQELNC